MRNVYCLIVRCAAYLGLCSTVLFSGCSCGDGKKSANACSQNVDCNVGYICVSGACVLDSATGGDCVDNDGDGYLGGDNCTMPSDCDDTDPERGGPELCGDDKDNDCDGQQDEIANLCGAQCTPSCAGITYPSSAGQWTTPDASNSSNVTVGSDGAITLGLTLAQNYYLWSANTEEGTVSKVDTKTGAEVARYPSVLPPPVVGDWYPWDNDCPANWSAANCPSRTAVDQALNAYVANRAFSGQGTLSKIVGDISKCSDRNGDGTIQTSHDINGGGIDINYVDSTTGDREFYSGSNGVPIDECIAWTVKVGTGGVPRAVAVGLSSGGADDFGVSVGDVWVGIHYTSQFVRLSPTGEVLTTVGTDTMRPYGAALDSAGRLWFVGRYAPGNDSDPPGSTSDQLAYIDTNTNTFSRVTPAFPLACTGPWGYMGQPYGMTVDSQGVVYFAFQCGITGEYKDVVASYDLSKSEGERWRVRTLVDSGGNPYRGLLRGVAVDDQSIWVADSHNLDANGNGSIGTNTRAFQLDLAKFNDPAQADGAVLTQVFPNIGCSGPVGMGISLDEDKSIWAVCYSGQAARFTYASNTWVTYNVGPGPYTYSDFMGYTLLNNAETTGRYAFTTPGCAQGTTAWLGLSFPSAVLPAADSLAVRVLSAASASELDLADTSGWQGPFAVDPTIKEVNFATTGATVADNPILGVELLLKKSATGQLPKVYSVETVVNCVSNGT